MKTLQTKWSLMAALLVLALSLVTTPILASNPADKASDLQAKSEGKVVVETARATGAARWVHANGAALTREFAGKGAAPEAVAQAFLDQHGSLFGLAKGSEGLKLNGVRTDGVGIKHVRYAQTHKGLPVFGADLVVHLDADGTVREANGYVVPGLDGLNTTPALDAKAAAEVALKGIAAEDATAASVELMILNPGLLTDQKSETYLVYQVKVTSEAQPELGEVRFVDAATGDIRLSTPTVFDARDRKTYNLATGTRYNRATLVRIEGQAPVTSATSCTAQDVNNAHDYAGDTYDFYFNRFGRDSYNNAGASLLSYVCYGRNYQNAFWDGSKMTYGAGFAAADDVVAHELSHAVTEYASGLVYSYQSGALNESFSDIFGEAVDLVNAKGTDTNGVRWDMGEDIPGFGAIRDMMDPTRFGDPDKVSSANYYCGTSDNGGVHTNSGVPNKAFALMVDGGSFNGYNVGAIGIDKAVQVQYRANEYYLTSSSKFADNANALKSACSDLYGAASADCANVTAAINAVEMARVACQ